MDAVSLWTHFPTGFRVCRFARCGGRACTRIAAAVFGEEFEQAVHARIIRAADDRTAVARVVDESRPPQRVQMVRQGRRRYARASLKIADRKAFRSGLY